MLTSAQRAKLRGMATAVDPIFQIGKGGIGENFARDLQTALDAHELVKITVLKNSGLDAKEALESAAKAVGAEPITAIGNKIVLYKRSVREDVEHITL